MLEGKEIPINEFVDDDVINESMPLLAPTVQKDGGFVTACNVVGALTTFMAMVPQGILGALLADKILLQLNEDFKGKNIPLLMVRIGVDGLIFITAEEGKRRLVRFFNTETFKNFGRKKWWQESFLTRWNAIDVSCFLLNAGFTVVASAVFSGLAALSFDGIAELLQNYDSPITDAISPWVKSYYVKAPFMVATFISNLPFFITVHKNAYRSFKNFCNYLIINPRSRRIRQDLACDVRAAQYLWKQINEKGDEVAKLQYLAAYNTVNEGSLTKRLINIGREVDKEITPESWPEFLIKHGVGIGFTSLGIIGLHNFLDMTDRAAALFYVEKAAPVLRWMDYASMSAVALGAIYPMALTFIASVFLGRNYNVNMISTCSYVWIILSTFMVCTLGGAPNAYQSVLAKENLFFLIIAAIDSLLMEFYGYYQLTKSNKVAALSRDNPEITQAYEVDAEIEQVLAHVEDTASAQEVGQLAEAAVVPPYRSFCTSISNSVRYCFFASPQTSIINDSDDQNGDEENIKNVLSLSIHDKTY